MSDLGNKLVFASNLKRYMKKFNIDRYQLCDALGFKYSTVSEWLAANKYPRIDKIEKMANYFGIQKSDLIEKYDVKISKASSDSHFSLTPHETNVINAYRDKPEMQPAVDTLLGVAGDSTCKTIKVAAYGGGITELELHADDDTIDIELNEDSSI